MDGNASPTSPTNPNVVKSIEEGGTRGNRSCSSSSTVGGTSLVPNPGENNIKEPGFGAIAENSYSREKDEEGKRDVAAGQTRAVHNRKENEAGQRFFEAWFEVNSFTKEEISLYQRGYKEQSFNQYRKGYTLFANSIQHLDIRVEDLNEYSKVAAAMRRVLIEIGKSTVSKSKTNAMITAISAASNRIFNRSLSLDRSIMDLVKAIEKEFPKEVAQRPKNELKLKPILNTIQRYGRNNEMPLTNLQVKVLVLVLILGP
jgi:hypothetical protein